MNVKKAPGDIPGPPDHLSVRSQGIWRALAGKRIRSIPRLALLQIALESLDRADQATANIGDNLTLTSPRSGVSHVNPLVRVERESRQLFCKIMTLLSLHGEAYNPFPYGNKEYQEIEE